MKIEREAPYEQFARLKTTYASEWPLRRPLKIFALDPLTGTTGNRISIDIPNEKLGPGPAGDRITVIDYDGTLNVFYAPVDLDEPAILMQGGLDPSESDPRFHQQMVYAVAMRVLENFERALGRTLRFAKGRELRILPHAFRGENAFFDPSTNAVLFGYFAADEANPGENLPGQTVFSCLSHDIVAHEVTHAIIFRLRRHFNEPSNPDVLSFHEAIADIVAIFQHFTVPEVLRDQIQRTHGNLREPGVLIELAKQFGHGTGRTGALRSALEADGPSPDDYRTIMEPHARGSLLVAAVFDAFFVAYQNRIRDVVRLATGGTGVLPTGDLPSDLVTILAAHAASTAQNVLTMCIRAFEFLPPVDVTFGDYLRALVTTDRELYPEDKLGMRDALIDAFRVRGIYPKDVVSLAEESLVWPAPDDGLPKLARAIISDLMTTAVLGVEEPDDVAPPNAPPEPDAATPAAATAEAAAAVGDGSPPAGEPARRGRRRGRMSFAARSLHEYAVSQPAALGLVDGLEIEVQGYHPTFRIGSNGRVRVDIVAQFVQERETTPEERRRLGGLRLYSGSTVIFSEQGEVRYVIAKPLAEERIRRQGRATRSIADIEEHIGRVDLTDDDLLWRDAGYLERRMIERANFAVLDRRQRMAR